MNMHNFSDWGARKNNIFKTANKCPELNSSLLKITRNVMTIHDFTASRIQFLRGAVNQSC